MAATDKPYRTQHTLDIVFAISSLAMLASIVWMFVDDYNRPFKAEQRSFRTVEAALAQRQAIDQIPNRAEFDAKKATFDAARKAYAAQQGKLDELKAEIASMRPERERADSAYQKKKADVESISSFYAIALERNETKAAEDLAGRLSTLNAELAELQARRDEVAAKMKERQMEIDAIEQPLTKAQSDWKKVTDKFDTQVKTAYAKQWGWGDWFRTLPILDAFASPVKIQQITNNDIPIDYNFKMVTRFDRCTTCHLGIDRPAYTQANLRELTKVTPEQEKRLQEAHELLTERTKAYTGLAEASKLPSEGQLKLTPVSESVLTPSRVREYAAHPRLDLFVGAKSKHPMEKFGCSACHYGQGSATDFTLAAHTPNSAAEKDKWVQEHGWEAQHMWDFPMRPHRFVEASCIKCHREVTDLVGSDNREEAPKLLRGYNLIKEFGCFGCHEIAGTKGGNPIGPDLRLEPTPPLVDLSPGERTKLENDPENPPGHLRKVGPSLFRLGEKTNPAWTVKWIRAPRAFRPDTKMPHFYGLSNNHPDVLPKEQKDFPDAEIQAIAYYLFAASNQYLKEITAQQAADRKQPQARLEDEMHLQELLAKGMDKLDAAEKTELTDIRLREKLRKEKVLTDQAPKHPGDPAKGRQLFTERGCLACHQHEGTTKAAIKVGEQTVAAVHGTAEFGPNLSQVAAKLGTTAGDKKSARVWLIQWIMDPHVHSPRSRMPVTHLTGAEAADVAAWLLAQPQDLSEEWQTLKVTDAEPNNLKYLKELAKVYLIRLLPRSDVTRLLDKPPMPEEETKERRAKLQPLIAKGEKLTKEQEAELATVRESEEFWALLKELPPEEYKFADAYARDRNAGLKNYLGKKAVGRYGCYACHDIPGFDSAKPIGVGLNDWGKKDPARLAFDNIDNFVEAHFYKAPGLTDAHGKPNPFKVEKEDGKDVTKKPYEQFYWDELMHRQRTGFLNQKIIEPRSYDFGMKRAWDDRYRMPQFRFGKTHRRVEKKNADGEVVQQGETDAEYAARAWQEEAEAREAVMTFILGLVAEQVPLKMVNQPSGDRLMEVKGRQVLDKFNCAGCHLLRPGPYDLKLTPPSLKMLEKAHLSAEKQRVDQGLFTFPGHHLFWTGATPTGPDRVVVPGVFPKLLKEDEEDEKAPYTHLQVVLAEAVRFYDTDPKTGQKVPRDVPASTKLRLPLEDLVPGLKGVASPEELDRLLGAESPWGGRFSNLLVKYLALKDPTNIRLVEGDSGNARASLPPPLYGEGERTQPQWLFQFLLEPTAVRRMAILRMPKFNLSRAEARQLVDYFAAVEKITNPGIGLSFPGEDIPQQSSLDSPYWQRKNSEYLARLKGNDKLYQQRLASYAGAWKQAAELARAGVQADLDNAKRQKEESAKQLKEKEAELKKAAGKAKEELEKQVKALRDTASNIDEALKKLDEKLKQTGPDTYKQEWLESEAYAADALRLVMNYKDTCLKCHQVGPYPAGNPVTQGPPLYLAHERLRPGWVFRWVSDPQRHLPYDSPMPMYFKRPVPGENKPPEYQDIFAGTPREQIAAARDVLMNFPRVLALPINQQYNPTIPQLTGAGEQKGENKKGEKK